jgi:hypothetical protein
VGQLQVQRQQIVDIELEIDALDSNIVRAEKLVLNFTRRMATDRIIQLFTAINIVLMLVLILYVAISGKSLSPSSGGKGGGGSPSIYPSLRPSVPVSAHPS